MPFLKVFISYNVGIGYQNCIFVRVIQRNAPETMVRLSEQFKAAALSGIERRINWRRFTGSGQAYIVYEGETAQERSNGIGVIPLIKLGSLDRD